MDRYLVLTVLADDRPGIVERIARVVLQHQGNWLESSMSHLSGKFAGILHVAVPEDQRAALEKALKNLADEGIPVSVEGAEGNATTELNRVTIGLVCNDRPGIVGEISSLLANAQVSVETLATTCATAPMSSDVLFRLRATLALPPTLSEDALRDCLEGLSDDLIVEIDAQTFED